MSPPSSGSKNKPRKLKMEVAGSSETSVDFQRTTRRYNPEDGTLHNHRCENLKRNNKFYGKQAYANGSITAKGRLVWLLFVQCTTCVWDTSFKLFYVPTLISAMWRRSVLHYDCGRKKNSVRSYRNLNMETYEKVRSALRNSTMLAYLQEHVPSVTRVCVLFFPPRNNWRLLLKFMPDKTRCRPGVYIMQAVV
jgi:hypothetical protein